MEYFYLTKSWTAIPGYLCLSFLTFFPRSSGVSHSVLADMQTIQQETPTLTQSSSHSKKYSDDDDEEEGYFFVRWDESLTFAYNRIIWLDWLMAQSANLYMTFNSELSELNPVWIRCLSNQAICIICPININGLFSYLTTFAYVLCLQSKVCDTEVHGTNFEKCENNSGTPLHNRVLTVCFA